MSLTYTAAAGRKFGLTLGIALGVLASFTWWRDQPRAFVVLAAIGGVLILAGLVIPTALGPVDRGWMKFAHALSRVTTPLFMGIIYFGVLTPVGFLRRRFGGNPLMHRPGPHGLWFDRSDTPRSSLSRLF